MLDPLQAPAAELAGAYRQRWEIETTFDEFKTHQRGRRRSKSPDLVLQEIWGHLCCHCAIRTLMFETAASIDIDPDLVSFVASLRVARQSLAATPGGFPPDDPAARTRLWREAIVRLLRRLNPRRRLRTAPRVIKRKMPKWHVKRAHHAHWPQPTVEPAYTPVPH